MPHFFNALIFWQQAGGVIITSLEDIIRTEGLRGMYRGLSPTLVALLPNWAVSITFLDFLPKKESVTGISLIIERDVSGMFGSYFENCFLF